MGFRNGAYATLWKIDKAKNLVVREFPNYAEIYISISVKNNFTNKYEVDFSSKVRCIGKAFEKIKKTFLKEKDKIQLLDVETTNKYKPYCNYICYDLEILKNKTIIKDIEVVESNDFDFYNNDGLPF